MNDFVLIGIIGILLFSGCISEKKQEMIDRAEILCLEKNGTFYERQIGMIFFTIPEGKYCAIIKEGFYEGEKYILKYTNNDPVWEKI